MHPKDSKILLAGTGHAFFDQDGGIYRTVDGGLNWSYVGGGDRVVSVEISTKNPQIAYAGDVAHSKFFSSEDGGVTWKTLTRKDGESWGPDNIFAGWPIDLQVDPRDPTRIFVNNYGGGNFLSENGGNTWSVSSTGYSGAQIHGLIVDSDNAATVYATGTSGTFRSYNGGITWEGLGENLISGVSIIYDPERTNTLFFGRGHLMLFQKSTDWGENWKLVINHESQLQNLQKLGTGADWQGITAVSFAPSDPNTMYAGVIQYWCFKFGESCDVQTIFSIAKSNDRGDTWQPIYGAPFNGSSVTDIVVHPKQPDTVWVATEGKGLFQTTDGGLSWEKISTKAAMDHTRSLEIDPEFPDLLMAGTLEGVYVSQDSGATWIHRSDGMNNNDRIWDIVMDPTRHNVFYAGSLGSGIYFSKDFGATWQLINNGLTNRAVYTLSISSDGETLYAGTSGEGVFRLSTHDQSYFDSLAPTPTAIPSTITPTSLAVETPAATSTPVLSVAPSTAPESSTTLIYVGGVIVLLIGFVAFALWRRKSKGE